MGGLRTGIRPGYIAATSKMVTDCSGMVIQPHKVCPSVQSDTCAHMLIGLACWSAQAVAPPA